MRFKWIGLFVVAVGTFAGGWLLRRGLATMGAGDGAASTSAPSMSPTKLFSAVLQTVRGYAVDSLDESGAYRLATSGVLGELLDPYAALVSAADTAQSDRIGARPAQGVYLDRVEDFVEVVAVAPGSPAAAAGIRPGDAVVRVGETTVENRRPEEVARLIDGDSGTSVRIRLGREGQSAPLWVTIVRGPVPALPGPASSGDGSIVELRIRQIDSATVAMTRAVLDSAVAPRGRGVVIDLRGVVEGSLADAVAMAEGLLDQGDLIVTVRGRSGTDSIAFRDQSPTATGSVPVVVLVDRATAGAAEVVAAALQDHDRAAIVGETTFGRGARQSYFPLGNGSILRLTTALWISPSGRTLQRFRLPSASDAPTDSVPPRPRFKTDAGRTILGGGGIVPDREIAVGVEPSRSSDPALELARRLLARAKTRQALIAALDPA